MKKLMMLALVSILAGCQPQDGKDGVSIKGDKGDSIVGETGPQGAAGIDGSNGTDGVDANVSPLLPVGILAPCAADPNAPTALELQNPMLEILLKLSNGQVLTSFSQTIQGYNTHLAILAPGTYQSTGQGNCIFTLSALGIITR